MKKIFCLAICIILFVTAKPARADDLKINAGVLPSIWYSTLTISKDNQIDIYGGIQNHSDIGFSFTATMYLDGTVIGNAKLVSSPNTLVEISDPWTAIVGSHSIQLKITDIAPLDTKATTTLGIDSLVSSESNAVTVSVSQNITLNSMQTTVTQLATNALDTVTQVGENIPLNNTETAVMRAASNVLSTINIGADNLSNTIEELKQSVATNATSTTKESQNKNVASVTMSTSSENLGTSLYNKVLDFSSLIVKNWEPTLFVGSALTLIVKFMI